MALTAIPVGFVAGLFGIGGGLITVPFLYYIFNSLKINPNYIEAANNIGLIYLQRKQYDLAQDFFSKTIKINENWWKSVKILRMSMEIE